MYTFSIAAQVAPQSSSIVSRADASSKPSTVWLKEEPTTQLLQLIKYTDSKGNGDEYRPISKIQNDCKNLGIRLGIDRETLRGFDKNNVRPPAEVCEDILDEWIRRGQGDVSWGGLLQALEAIQLNGVAKHLRDALTLCFKNG